MMSDTLTKDSQSPLQFRGRSEQIPLAGLGRSFDGLPEFEVFVLGTKGSGKTVFLAALYQCLAAQDKRRNAFRLRCDASEQRIELNNIREELQSPDSRWPPSNFEAKTFNFVCVHDLQDKEIGLFRFNYVDYPGGYISQRPEKIDAYVARAHSILALLDGQKIYDLLVANNSSYPAIYAELDKIIPVLSNCGGRPIHFLVTKSDLFDMEVQTLEKIRDALFRHSNFRNLVEHLCECGVVHLVPISAVGKNFAVYEGGQMKLKKGAIMEPLYVDLSIGLTLVDQIRFFKKYGGSNQDYSTSARLWAVRKGQWVVAKMLNLKERVMQLNTSSTFSVFMAHIPINLAAVLTQYEKYLQMANRKFDTTATGLEEEIKRLTESIQDKNSALTTIVQIQTALVAAFEKKFPASDLATAFTEQNP